MRLLVVSDIHANHTALRRVLEEVPDIDTIICAGDITGYGPRPNECIETLKRLRAVCVKGNHDEAATSGDTTHLNTYAAKAMDIQRGILKSSNLEWLNNTPKRITVNMDNIRIHVVHGSPWNPYREYLYPDDIKRRAEELLDYVGTDMLVLGHTHHPCIHQTEHGFIINPGSVGQPRDGDPKASYMTVDTNRPHKVIHGRIDYDINLVTERIHALGIPKMLALRLHRGQ